MADEEIARASPAPVTASPASAELAPERLYQACDPASLDIHTTAELEDLRDAVGQARALEALQLGIAMPHEGYNLFVMGSTGLGKATTVKQLLEARAPQRPAPPDWCYVNNFRAPHRPKALRLPAGAAIQLQRDMRDLMRSLLTLLPVAFESDEYQARLREINAQFKSREEAAFQQLTEDALRKNVLLVKTPLGFTIAPQQNGEILDSDAFERLPAEQRKAYERDSEEVRAGMRQLLQNLVTWRRERDQRIDRLNEEVARHQVGHQLAELEMRYRALPDVLAFLADVQRDLIENVDEIRKYAAENKGPPDASQRLSPFNRYYVNVIVDHSSNHGAPVIHEDHPTYQNLVGRVEHLAQFGTLLTDFTMIKPGVLHRANGGFLVLDARKVLTHPFSWEALKRALRGREIRLQNLEQMLSLASTISLEPEPIPLDVKVILIGERLLYYLLSEYDPEFGLLFKIEADFAEDLPRTPGNTRLYARLVATIQRREKLRPMDRDAVARLLEHAARLADDSGKLSLQVGRLVDLMREADHWAGASGADVLRAAHVQQAIDARIRRADQLRERVHDSILKDVRLIDTAGAKVAEVNGLAVIQLGQHAFGHPSRITATARLGEGKVVDIEREVELGGAVHSKGVLILSAFLAQRFAHDQPLSLAASLVFEQSYGGVEGDSASMAELCALLSALSQLPLRQELAVTGSVNQHGGVQAIGGVNEKIEGFFDICRARGLTGTQGVIVPQANVRHLMLRRDVVEAAREGRFHVYAVAQVDEAMELLTGTPAGAADAHGAYPEGTVNGRVQRRLVELSALRQRYAHPREARNKDGK